MVTGVPFLQPTYWVAQKMMASKKRIGFQPWIVRCELLVSWVYNLVVSNIFFMFIPKIGEDTHFWRAYFSKGVGETPPSSNLQVLIWSPFLLLRLWSSAALASCVSWLCVGWCITLRWVVSPILPCSTWEGLGKVGVGCWVGRLVGCSSFLRWIWFNLPVWDVYYA